MKSAILAVALLLASAPVARAQPELSAKQKKQAAKFLREARKEKAAGDELAGKKRTQKKAMARYRRAAMFYHEVHELLPVPGVVFELAEVYDARGEAAWARRGYRRYLELDPDGEHAEAAEERAAAMEAMLAAGDGAEGERGLDPTPVFGEEPKLKPKPKPKPKVNVKPTPQPRPMPDRSAHPERSASPGDARSRREPEPEPEPEPRRPRRRAPEEGGVEHSGGARARGAGEAGEEIDPETETGAEAETETEPERDDLTAKPGRTLRWSGIATAGAGVLFVGLAVKYGVDARSASNALSNKESQWTDEDAALIEKGETADKRLKLFSVLGGAALVGGGVLYYLGHRKDARAGAEASAWAPVVSPDGVGIAWTGRFE
jgi:hypothetical protein